MKPRTKSANSKITCLSNKFSNYHDFRVIAKQDVLAYLNSLRKTELIDPLHKGLVHTTHDNQHSASFLDACIIKTNQIRRKE